MRPEALAARRQRHQVRAADVSALQLTPTLYLPWKDDLRRNLTQDLARQALDHPPLPIAVQLRDKQQSPSHAEQPHRQTKTFAELQQISIRNDLVGEAVGRARLHMERG
jgi:hypothetical protein